MRGSGLEREKSILSTLTKIGFPSKLPFMNSIQQTFIEHLLSVQLCESDKDESLLFKSPHNIVGCKHIESSNDLDEKQKKFPSFLKIDHGEISRNSS